MTGDPEDRQKGRSSAFVAQQLMASAVGVIVDSIVPA
jgi:hypothetical protein